MLSHMLYLITSYMGQLRAGGQKEKSMQILESSTDVGCEFDECAHQIRQMQVISAEYHYSS